MVHIYARHLLLSVSIHTTVPPWPSCCQGPLCAPRTPPQWWSWPHSFWRCSASLFQTCPHSGRLLSSDAGGRQSFWWQSRYLQAHMDWMSALAFVCSPGYWPEMQNTFSHPSFDFFTTSLNPDVHRLRKTHIHTHDTTGHLLWFLSHWSFDSFIYPLKTTLLWVRMGLNEFLRPAQHWATRKRTTHPDHVDIFISHLPWSKDSIPLHHSYPSKWYFWPISRMSFSHLLNGNEVLRRNEVFRIS